jgi:hypothetical protein
MILQDALQMMENVNAFGDKVTFDLDYVTFDFQRKQGGEVKSLKGVRKIGSRFHQKANQMINVQAPGNSRHPYPVHIRLILKVNGEKINW